MALRLSQLDGENGFRIEGIDGPDFSGGSVAGAGDVNGDGVDDLIIGAAFADPGGRRYAGESYVVFGSGMGFASSVELSTLDGANGFRLGGIDAFDLSGSSVAGAGDVSGDGIDALMLWDPETGTSPPTLCTKGIEGERHETQSRSRPERHDHPR